MSEWISVENQMPTDVGQEYWVCVIPNAGIESDGSVTTAQFGRRLRTVKTYLSKSGEVRFNCGALEEVTHWQKMPTMPELPKEQQ